MCTILEDAAMFWPWTPATSTKALHRDPSKSRKIPEGELQKQANASSGWWHAEEFFISFRPPVAGERNLHWDQAVPPITVLPSSANPRVVSSGRRSS